MAENRINREQDTRVKAERPKQWMPPQLLPNPDPEPGYGYRWIRVSTLGTDDPMNISSKLREGWEPVKASEHPEIQLMGGGKNRYPDSIEIGGLLLCKTPIEFAQQRDAFYQQQAGSRGRRDRLSAPPSPHRAATQCRAIRGREHPWPSTHRPWQEIRPPSSPALPPATSTQQPPSQSQFCAHMVSLDTVRAITMLNDR